MGYDGSSHCTAMGHDFISVSLVGAAYREAFPVYAKLGRGRHCHADLVCEAIRAVKQEFALEKARVRTFRRLENIFAL